MQTTHFRINEKEHCHINEDVIFIINGKEVTRVPLEHELSEAWGIASILNYILFVLLFGYVSVSINMHGADFFRNPFNYGALFLMILSFMRIQQGLVSSKTPTIYRSKIRSVYFKTPFYSYPRLVIYFEGPEGKVLRRTFPILYKQEALPVLKETGLIN
jgi:hypothetical protein